MSNEPTQERSALDVDDAAEALLAKWTGDENLPEDEVAANPEDSVDETTDTLDDEDSTSNEEVQEDDDLEEGDTDETDTETEEDSDSETEEDETVELDDDTEIEYVVDGETKSASIKSLKRLAGQEASLTRKSQELSAQRKTAREALERSDLVLQRLLQQATERMKPYSEIDMMVASKNMGNEEFAKLRQEAQAAANDLKFLQEEADSFYQHAQQEQKKVQREMAKQCVETLKDEIPDWSNKMYDEIRAYAVQNGMDSDLVNQIVDPISIQLINKARLFDQGKQVATVKKKKAVTRKTLRSKKTPDTDNQTRKAKQDKARQSLALQKGNDFDAMADLIMERWTEN